MSERLMAAVANAPVTPALQGLVERAGTYAAAQGHRTVKLEHLLLTLTEDGEAVHLLETCSVDVSRLRTEIAQYLDHHDDRDPSGETIDPPPHPELLRAIAHAAAAARGRAVGPPVVLAAVVGEGTTTAASLLSVQGFSFQAAVTALQQIAARARAQAGQGAGQGAAQGHAGQHAPQPPPQPVPQQMPPARPVHVYTPQPAAQPDANQPGFASRPGDVVSRSQAAVIGAEELMDSARRSIESARLPAPPPLPPRALPEVVANLPPPLPPAAGTPPVPSPQTPPMMRRPVPPAVNSPPQAYPGAPSDLFAPNQPRQPSPLGVRPASQAPSGAMPQVMPEERPTYGARRDTGSQTQRPQFPHHGPAGAPPQVTRPPGQPSGYAQPPGEYDHPTSPHLEQVARRRPSAPPPSASGPVVAGRSSSTIRQAEIGRLVETIPRRASVGESRTVEVRVRRADIAGFMPAHTQRASPDGRVMQAVCVRLRAPDGGIAIETLTPETAWLDADAGGLADEYATWRWRLLPMMRGRRKLVLSLTVRRVGEEGLTAETNLPDQVFEVSVRANFARLAAWVGGIAATLVIGFVAGSFGKAIVSGTLAAIARLSSG